MKITPEHYAELKAKIVPYKDRIPEWAESIKYDPRIKDFNKRLRWDVMYLCNCNSFVCQELYKYLNDTHIDTALKSIMEELTINK